MNDEHKEWSKQYTSSIGVKEFFRVGCAIILWVFIGVGISLAFELNGYSIGSIIFSIFFIAMFVFPFIAFRYKPAYLFLRKVLGNKSLPTSPPPSSNEKTFRQPRPWWSYLPSLWWLLMLLLLLYIILKR